MCVSHAVSEERVQKWCQKGRSMGRLTAKGYKIFPAYEGISLSVMATLGRGLDQLPENPS